MNESIMTGMDAQRKRRVGLAQINNSFSGQNYLPYSVGLLQAYAQRYARNPESYEFLPPLYKREGVRHSAVRLASSEIVFFSAYVWNQRQSLAIARTLKESDPDRVIVFGGPQIPERAQACEEFLRESPFVDACVHGEGEQAFLEILESDFAERARAQDWSGIASLSFLDSRGKWIRNSQRARIQELDRIPSPYLEGTFNAVMKANPEEKWILMWETNRGCPFSCAFCDWGSATASRVYKFGLERLRKEVDWMAERKIEFVFCADANFGMFDADLELVRYVAESKRRTGYPHALSVQNTKNATEKAYRVQKLLSDAGLNKGVTLSLQSLDAATLKNIKRANISSESYQELQRRFTRDHVETYTDVILGLPGETYESFIEGVSRIVFNGQHNRVQFNNLSILPNAAMGDPAYQREHGLVLVESPIVNFHGAIQRRDQEGEQETQVLVVGTNSCSRADWVRMRAFAWACQLLYFNKTLQIPLLLARKTSFKDLISLFMEGDLGAYPTLREIRDFFFEKARDIQNGGPEYCASEEYLGIWWPADELVLIRLFAEGKLDAFYRECESLLQGALPAALLADAIALNRALMKQPFLNEDLTLSLEHQVWEAYLLGRAGREGVSVAAEAKQRTYVIDRTSQRWETLEDWCREVIWWGNKKGAYLYSGVSERQMDGHF